MYIEYNQQIDLENLNSRLSFYSYYNLYPLTFILQLVTCNLQLLAYDYAQLQKFGYL
jgi:hypothetical protein